MKSFEEISSEEMMEVDGGAVWEAATGLVALAGGALVGGFMAGRQFIRDVKAKFF